MGVLGVRKLEIPEHEKDQSIQRWVYHVLRTNIVKLKLPPAEQISENEVSDALKVSRTPVREAFIRLAEEGLVKITPQKRTVVSPINLEQAEEARFIRCAIEKAVWKEACGSLTNAVKAELRACIGRQLLCRKARAYDQMLADDDAFHGALFRVCGKEQSWRHVQKLNYNIDRLRVLTMPHTIAQVISEHQQILKAIGEGRIERIDALVDEHTSLKAIEAVIRDSPREYFQGYSAQVFGVSEPVRRGVARKERKGGLGIGSVRLQTSE